MFGLEILGAIGAAATLLELAKKCSQQLEKVENTTRDFKALRERLKALADTIAQVSNALNHIKQHDGDQNQTTDAGAAMCIHMDAILKLCDKTLVKFKARLDQLPLKNGKSKLSTIPPEILRRIKDLDTYISALNTSKGFFLLYVSILNPQSSYP